MELRPEGQRLRVNCDFRGPVEVEGNPSLLSSVFRNLADNAAAYSGGRDIFIRLLSDTAEACTILFADNGIGVDEEHLPAPLRAVLPYRQGALAQAGRHGTRAFDRQKRRRDPRRDDHRTQRRTRRAGIRFHPAQTFIRAQPDCNVFCNICFRPLRRKNPETKQTMSPLFTCIVIIMGLLAVMGIVVGVANDAVNSSTRPWGRKSPAARHTLDRGRRHPCRDAHIERHDGGRPKRRILPGNSPSRRS